MATLEINGRRVQVDDAFRNLSPEQQQATVEEIAASLGAQTQPQRDSRAQGAASSWAPGDQAMSGGGLEAGLIGLTQGLSFGLVDEANAALRAGYDRVVNGKPFGEAYDQRLAQERSVLSQVREENPLSSLAGEVVGGAVIPAGAAAKGATVAQQAVRGAAAGAATGGLYGFGQGEGGVANRTQDAAVSGAIGGAVGAAAPYVVRGAQSLATGRSADKAVQAAVKDAPTADALRAESSRLYDAARARGVEIKPDVIKNFAADVAQTAMDEGLDPVLTPRASRAVERITAIGDSGSVKWKDLELARRVSGIAAQSTDPNERRMAGIVSEKIDDFVVNLVDGDLTSGTAEGLGSEIAQARKLWGQMRNSERMTQAMEKAKDAASGYENGLRIEFRKLVNDQKFWRGLSASEKDAVLAVVRGTPTGNILKRVSRLSFGAGAQTNVLGASLGSGMGATAGSALGGPVGAMVGATVPPLVGRAAARGAEKATERAAATAQGLAAIGGLPVEPRPADLVLLRNALSRSALPAVASVNALSSGWQR